MTKDRPARELKLPAFQIKQGENRLLISLLKAGDLPFFTNIDHWDSQKEALDPTQGYQRPAQLSRAKKFANWLRKEEISGALPIMPSAILASSRTPIELDADGTITLSTDHPLYLVDGQHRMEGFKYAIREKGMQNFYGYEVPLVIMSDVSKEVEMEQFRVVNSTQKAVRTDLVNMILSALAESKGDSSIEPPDSWRVVVSRCVRDLNQDLEGAWYDRIVMPDSKAYTTKEKREDPLKEHRRIVRATSFMTSLKPVESFIQVALGEAAPLEERANILTGAVGAFWSALQDLNPDAFAQPGFFVIQKTPGLFSLHQLCNSMMSDMYRGRIPWTVENFKERLEDIGDVCEPTFWSASHPEYGQGEAATYGSMKGFAELARRLLDSYRSAQEDHNLLG